MWTERCDGGVVERWLRDGCRPDSVGLWERFDDAKLIRFARRLTLKVGVPRCRRDVASPLADLLAVLVTNIKYLNAGETSGFAISRPEQ
jgi:hypothetical protein